MMRIKLIGANRATFKGCPSIVRFEGEVEVDDNMGEHLLAQKAYSKTMGERDLWQLVRSTAGDSAATLDEPEVEEVEVEVDVDAEVEAEIDAEAEVATPTPVKKAAPKKAAPKARARKKTA